LAELLERESVAGKRILEVGAGTGVVGLTAAAHGAEVVLTDRDIVVPLLKENIRESDLPAQAMQLEWGDSDDISAAKDHGPYDVLVGSDILYAPERFDALLETLVKLSTPGKTEVILTYPTRFTESIFLEQAADCFEEIGGGDLDIGIFETRMLRRCCSDEDCT
jgi:predicted nicotinamide N-methyase